MPDPVQQALDDEQRQADRDINRERVSQAMQIKRNHCRHEGGDPDCNEYRKLFNIDPAIRCFSCEGGSCKYPEVAPKADLASDEGKPDILELLQAARDLFNAVDVLRAEMIPLGPYYNEAVGRITADHKKRLEALGVAHLFDWSKI